MAYQTVSIKEPAITVASDEDDNSPTWNLTADGMTGRRLVRVAWAEAFEFCEQMVGGVEHTGSSFIFTLGHRWPYNKPTTQLRAVSARVRRFGGSTSAATHADGGRTKLINHKHALVEVDYASAYGNLFDLVEETFDPSMEFLTIPNRKLYWDSEKTDEFKTDEAPGKIIHQQAWIYTIKKWPWLPNDMDCQGKVNSVEIESLRYSNKTFAVGTLLFNPADIVDSVDYQGRPVFRITYQLLYKPETWNKVYKAGELTPRVFYDANGEVKIYQEADLRPLFLTT